MESRAPRTKTAKVAKALTRPARSTKPTKPAKPGRPANRRGSPEAVEKRRVARLFNDVLGGRRGGGPALDGRTEKRRLRLLAELESNTGRGGRPLKPLDVLTRVHELLGLGEDVPSLRRVVKPRKLEAPLDEVVAIVERLHRAYGFRPETYRFVGIDDAALTRAGVLERERARASGRGVSKDGAKGVARDPAKDAAKSGARRGVRAR